MSKEDDKKQVREAARAKVKQKIPATAEALKTTLDGLDAATKTKIGSELRAYFATVQKATSGKNVPLTAFEEYLFTALLGPTPCCYCVGWDPKGTECFATNCNCPNCKTQCSDCSGTGPCCC